MKKAGKFIYKVLVLKSSFDGFAGAVNIGIVDKHDQEQRHFLPHKTCFSRLQLNC